MEVPVSGAVISEADKLALVEVALSGWYTEGPKCKEFSDKLRKYVGVNHVTLCNSGSSASLLALSAVNHLYINQRKVVTCAVGFPTTIAPIIQKGFIPVFVDIDPNTLNPKLEDVLEALRREDVAGYIQAHTLGFPYEADKIAEFCHDHNKFFIEDISDALGAEVSGKKVGSFGDLAICSFFPAHQICAGEGGAVFTNDGRLMRQVEKFRDWGRDCWCKPGEDNVCNQRFDYKWENLPFGYDHKYTFTEFGYNLKMTEFQAALGSSQMDRVDEFVKLRKNHFDVLWVRIRGKYYKYLKCYYTGNFNSFSPFGFPITLTDCPFNRKEIVQYLEDRGIRTRPVFAGNITRQPMFDKVPYEVHSDLKNSDFVMENTFWVGTWPGLTYEHLEYTISVIDEFMKSKGIS